MKQHERIILFGRGGDTTISTSIYNTGSPVFDDEHVMPLPNNIAAGNLLLLMLSQNGNRDSSSSGWTSLFTDRTGALVTDRRLKIFWREADGTEGQTVTVLNDGIDVIAAVIYRISNWAGDDPEVSASAKGTSALADPANLIPSWGLANTLWLPVASLRGVSVTAFPAGYKNNISTLSGSQMLIGTARKQTYATSEDAGPFTQDEADVWVAVTVGVKRL